jgi:hypothetical protein
VPLEVTVGAGATAESAGRVEIAIEGCVVRVDVGTDVQYVAELVRRLGAR